MNRPAMLYLAHTQPGFEAIAAEELAERLDAAQVTTTRRISDKNGAVFFRFAGDPGELLQLRTIEDVFGVVATWEDLEHGFVALRQLTDRVSRSTGFDAAIRQARQVMPGRGGSGRHRFRVISRQVGRASYRRSDAQHAVERAIAGRQDHRWQLVDEGGLEFWLTMWPEAGEAVLAVRLSDANTRHRGLIHEHLPASLRPSAAAALVWLTRPRPGDTFLDPMCGSATVLIERALAGRYQRLIGGDIDERALAAARRNVGSRYQPIDLHEWDAQQLPLDAGSITACAVNLPFGTQVGSTAENRQLYPALAREIARVMQPGGRWVALSGDPVALAPLLRDERMFTVCASHPVMLLGHRARVVVWQRR
jgi:tRNA (guanine6-N2)-methyltransferase